MSAAEDRRWLKQISECSGDHVTQAGTSFVEFGDNHDKDCLSIYDTNPDGDGDVIHICDWPAFKAAGDRHQRERGGRT